MKEYADNVVSSINGAEEATFGASQGSLDVRRMQLVHKQLTLAGFNCQLIHALEHFADFRHGAVCRLYNGNSVVGIVPGLGQPFNLCIHSLCHGQSGRIILGMVDL